MEEDDTLMDFEVSCCFVIQYFKDIFIETIFNINVGNIIYLIF